MSFRHVYTADSLYKKRGRGPGGFQQRGSGLGALFGPLVRTVVPFVAKHGARAAKLVGKQVIKAATSKTGKRVIKQAVKSASKGAKNVVGQAVAGGDVKEQMRKEVKSARERVGKAIQKGDKESGKGVKRKGAMSGKVNKPKKKKYTRVF